jgi:hypothetical protein
MKPASFSPCMKEAVVAGFSVVLPRRLSRPRRKRPSGRAAECSDEFAPSKANAHLALLCLRGKK